MRSLGILLFALAALPLQAQTQGIKGKVEWLSGNQMPGPGVKPTKAEGIKREIIVYPAVTTDQATGEGVFYASVAVPPITSVKSKANGRFCIELPAGEYSLFIKEKNGLFANRFDTQNRINCVVVEPGVFTETTIRVDYEAAY